MFARCRTLGVALRERGRGALRRLVAVPKRGLGRLRSGPSWGRLTAASRSPTVRGGLIVAAATVLVLVWLVALRAATGSDGDGSPGPAGAAQADCLLAVSGGTLRFAEDHLELLRERGIVWKPLAPASRVGRGALRLGVRGGSGVTCSAMEGVITSRGGFRLRRGERTLEFRRLRIDVAERRLEAVSDDPDVAPLPVAAVELRSADRVVTGGQLGVVAPLTVAPLYADALNDSFGPIINPGERLGTLRLSVREVAQEPEGDGR